MKKFLFACIFLISIFACFASPPDIKHNPWELIIYRPENSFHINDIRCWLKIVDMDGNDVTYSCCTATYEWVSIPDRVNYYQKTYYLSGGMAMHLNIKKGKYRFSVYTPKDKQYPNLIPNHEEWTSNEFYYDTDNPAKVLFVYPVADNTGFYTGEWVISHLAPQFKEFTIPVEK